MEESATIPIDQSEIVFLCLDYSRVKYSYLGVFNPQVSLPH